LDFAQADGITHDIFMYWTNTVLGKPH